MLETEGLSVKLINSESGRPVHWGVRLGSSKKRSFKELLVFFEFSRLNSNYPSINKNKFIIFQENTNGYLFDDSAELTRQICELSRGFPNSCAELDRLKRNMHEREFESWEVMWRSAAAPGAHLYLPEDGKAKLRATIQILLFVVVLLIPIHIAMGTFSGLF